MSSMKICVVVPWFPSLNVDTLESRQGLFAYRQLTKLAQRGNQFKVISIRWRGQPGYEVVADNMEVHRISPLFIFPWIRYPVPRLLALSRRIKEVCRSWKPDLLIFGHIIYLTALPIFWLKRRLGLPIIVTTDALPGISWFYGHKLVDFVGYLYSRFIIRRLFKLADGIQLMTFQLIKDTMKMNIEPDKIFSCPTGVDAELFKPGDGCHPLKETLAIGEGDKVILYVGRLDLVKGVSYLLEAAKKVSNAQDIKILIVGEGGLRREYEKLAGPLYPRVVFTGWRDDVPQLMRASDIFVLPSLSEGTANVVVEAGASGLPVIATEVGEIPRIISRGETGILVRPKDVDGLAKAIGELLDNPKLARQMGRAGRERIVMNYSWEVICDRLEQGYRKVIDRFQNGNGRKEVALPDFEEARCV